jgi:hypothetical protein
MSGKLEKQSIFQKVVWNLVFYVSLANLTISVNSCCTYFEQLSLMVNSGPTSLKSHCKEEAPVCEIHRRMKDSYVFRSLFKK